MASGFWSVAEGKNCTPTWSARVLSCSMAAGRYTSALTTITFFFWRSFRCFASLPTVVVLPAPCRPAIRITAGGCTLRSRPLACEPITAVSSSRTTLIRAWPGVSDLSTSWPTARTLIRSIRACTTGRATSASSSAMRTSRVASRMFSSVSRPRPRRRSMVPDRRWGRDSNMQGWLVKRTFDYSPAPRPARLVRNCPDDIRSHCRRAVPGRRRPADAPGRAGPGTGRGRVGGTGQRRGAGARVLPRAGVARSGRRGHALLLRGVAGRAGHGDPDPGGGAARAHGRAGGDRVPAGGAGGGDLRAGAACGPRGPGLAPAAARVVRPAGLRHPGGGGAAGGAAVDAGARPAPARVPSLAARVAAADGDGIAAVPHHRRGVRAAERHPAHRHPVRARLLRP